MYDFLVHFFESSARIIYFIGAVFAVLGWWKSRKIQRAQAELERLRNTPITLVLVSPEGQQLPLDYKLRRDQLSRSEIAGSLALYATRRRFELPGLLQIMESGHFNEVLEGKKDELRLPCPQHEWDQFRQEVSQVHRPENTHASTPSPLPDNSAGCHVANGQAEKRA